MDPNSDGFVSESALGFSNDGYNVDEFELKMFGIPKVGSGDTQAGAKCGTTDLLVKPDALEIPGTEKCNGRQESENPQSVSKLVHFL